jgi:YHS domain-containing protein
MLKILSVFIVSGLLFTACGGKVENRDDASNKHQHTTEITDKKEAFKNVAFAAKKDLVCGMPISAGISDTAHYNNKVYGFCNITCKEEFQKDPEAYLAAQ